MATSIESFKSLVAVDVLPCPDPIVEREVISALIEFCDKTQILTREMTLDAGAIAADTQDSMTLDMSNYESSMRPFQLLEVRVDGTGYIPKKRYIQDTNPNWDDVNESNVKYYWFTDTTHIQIFDMSASDSKIYVRVAYKPQRSATEVDDMLFNDWSEGIIAGAKWKILAMPKKEWTNRAAAAVYRTEWRRYLSRAKAMILRNMPGRQDAVNWQTFGDADGDYSSNSIWWEDT